MGAGLPLAGVGAVRALDKGSSSTPGTPDLFAATGEEWLTSVERNEGGIFTHEISCKRDGHPRERMPIMRKELLHPADVPRADANLAYQVGAVPDVGG